jgi:hypothetical protein
MATRRRGRPPKPLETDPDRHWLALLQALIAAGRAAGISAQVMAVAVVSLRYGDLTPDPGFVERFKSTRNRPTCDCKRCRLINFDLRTNVEAMYRGEAFNVFAPKYEGDPHGSSWRDGNAVRPRADNALRRLREIKDARWLAEMVRAWKICLGGRMEDAGLAKRIARDLGEGEYFETIMAPVLNDRFTQLVTGLERTAMELNSPELNAINFRGFSPPD